MSVNRRTANVHYSRFLAKTGLTEFGHFERKNTAAPNGLLGARFAIFPSCRSKPRAILPFAQRVAKRFVKRGSTIVSDHYLQDCSKNGPRRQP